MSVAEEIDTFTILRIKKEHGLNVVIPANSFKAEEYSELYRINKMMWELEDLISKESDFAKIGILYLALRYLTNCRVKEKNQISSKHNEPIELKDY